MFRQTVEQNLRNVLERIARAAEVSGRSASDVQLIAVTKYLSVEQTAIVAELCQAVSCDTSSSGKTGRIGLGESRPQVLWDKVEELGSEKIEWHMIGHLQRNKVKRTLQTASLIHSVDSLRLIQAIENLASELDVDVKILLEVNVSGDDNKGGFEQHDLEGAFEQIANGKRVSAIGLMCMGGLASNETELKKQFSSLRTTRDAWQPSLGPSFSQLSMGMSGDFELAIQEGATMVRVGSILYDGAL